MGTYNPGRSPIEVVLEDGALSVFGQTLIPLGRHAFVSEVNPDARFIFEMEGEKATALRLESEGTSQRAPHVEGTDRPPE